MPEPMTIAEWLATRPECVQKLAAEFPIDSRVEIDGKPRVVFGYTEDDQLIVVPTWCTIYDQAQAYKEYVCAKHFRKDNDDAAST